MGRLMFVERLPEWLESLELLTPRKPDEGCHASLPIES